MKYARKMVLVDINKAEQKPADSFANAINTLISANEFNRTNYGSNAEAVSFLDREMKAILDSGNMTDEDRLIKYNQCLQKYLFLIRQKVGQGPSVPVPAVPPAAEPAEPEPYATVPFNPFTPVVEATPSGSSAGGTPRTRRINLPRATPKEQRLRQERRKNSRYRDFFVNWGGLDRTVEGEEE